jgi:hypothetical protein
LKLGPMAREKMAAVAKMVQTNCKLGLDSKWIPTLLGVLLQLLL